VGEFVLRTLCTRDPIPLERRLAFVRVFGGDVGGVFVGVFGGGKWEMSRILGIE